VFATLALQELYEKAPHVPVGVPNEAKGMDAMV